jgi:hypothetical protein
MVLLKGHYLSLLETYAKRDKTLRQRGRLHFILVYGVGLWGIFTALISTMLFAYFTEPIAAVRFGFFSIFIFPILGAVVAATTWKQLFLSNDRLDH